MNQTSSPIFNVVLDFFARENWPTHQLNGEPVLQVNFKGNNGRWGCLAQAREAEYQFVFYSVCPANTPPEKRAAMAEFITRANYGLSLGNFEMDFNDGEVRFKTAIDTEYVPLNLAIVKQLVYTNLLIMDRYWPGIMAVMYGNALPAEAIAQVEEEAT